MIKSLRMVNFRNFADTTLRMGQFTLLLGRNGSGKSNVLDAFRFLNGTMAGYAFKDICGDKVSARGAIRSPARMGADNRMMDDVFSMQMVLDHESDTTTYDVVVSSPDANNEQGMYMLEEESLSRGDSVVYSTEYVQYVSHVVTAGSSGEPEQLSRYGAALPQLFRTPDRESLQAEIWETGMFDVSHNDSMCFVDSRRRRMNAISPYILPGQRMSYRTLSLASEIQAICANDDDRQIVLFWAGQLMDVEITDFRYDFHGGPGMFVEESNGRVSQAPDGLLELLYVIAAVMNTRPVNTVFIDNLGHSISPDKVWILWHLANIVAGNRGVQVVATTHTPSLMNHISEDALKYTSLVHQPLGNDYSVISPLTEFPDVLDMYHDRKLASALESDFVDNARSIEWDR